MSHGPIEIDGDADFRPGNGVVGGSGEPGDPWLIAGWAFWTTEGVPAVRVIGATKPFAVVNCTFEGLASTWGVFVENATGGVNVSGCLFSSADAALAAREATGVRVVGSSGVVVENSIFEGVESPVLVDGCVDVSLAGNWAHSFGRAAFEAKNSVDVLVANDVAKEEQADGSGGSGGGSGSSAGGGWGVWTYAAANVTVRNVTVQGTYGGAFLQGVNWSSLVSNVVAGTSVGAWLRQCRGVQVVGNAFIDDRVAGVWLEDVVDCSVTGNEVRGAGTCVVVKGGHEGTKVWENACSAPKVLLPAWVAAVVLASVAAASALASRKVPELLERRALERVRRLGDELTASDSTGRARASGASGDPRSGPARAAPSGRTSGE
ncbi:MAG: hypothetical protein Kow0069_39290 [Promethearchaeota archaeon]